MAIILFQKKRLPKRRYSLLINVAIGDIISSAIMFSVCISRIFITEGQVNLNEITSVFFFIPPIGMWLFMTSYISLNVFQVIAILKPIFYTTRVTPKHSYFICGLAWATSIGLASFVAATVNFQNPDDPQYMKVFVSVEAIIFGAFFSIILTTYIIIIFKTYGSRFCTKSVISSKQKNFSWKLGIHFLVFIATALPLIIIGFRALNSFFGIGLFDYRTPQKICNWSGLVKGGNMIRQILISILPLHCRAAIDPFIHILWDRTLRNPFQKRKPMMSSTTAARQ